MVQRLLKITLSSVIATRWLPALGAQDLAPRAYVITPLHWNAVTLSDAFTTATSCSKAHPGHPSHRHHVPEESA